MYIGCIAMGIEVMVGIVATFDCGYIIGVPAVGMPWPGVPIGIIGWPAVE